MEWGYCAVFTDYLYIIYANHSFERVNIPIGHLFKKGLTNAPLLRAVSVEQDPDDVSYRMMV